MLFLLFSLALASGPPVEITDPALCIDNEGYLNGVDFGGDCCQFVVCDAARLNKTGFLGSCMGGTAWNADLRVCDGPKYVTPACDPAADCVVPKRTTAECSGLEATQCCVGNREPVFEAGDDGTSYRKGDDRDFQQCPVDQVFNLVDCCCEPVYEVAPECEGDGYYFDDPEGDGCCTYIQCWQNRTGFEVVSCMPPSVWNSETSICDIKQNVMECMSAFCGEEVTDIPCDGSQAGDCCRNGIGYSVADELSNYIIEDDFIEGRVSCCPLDVDGQQMIFNFDDDVCCCESPVV